MQLGLCKRGVLTAQAIREVVLLDAGLNCRGAYLTDPGAAQGLGRWCRQRPFQVSLHGTPRQWGARPRQPGFVCQSHPIPGACGCFRRLHGHRVLVQPWAALTQLAWHSAAGGGRAGSPQDSSHERRPSPKSRNLDTACGARPGVPAAVADHLEESDRSNFVLELKNSDPFVSSSDSGKVVPPSRKGWWGKGYEMLHVGPSGCPARRWITEEKDRSGLALPTRLCQLQCLSTSPACPWQLPVVCWSAAITHLPLFDSYLTMTRVEYEPTRPVLGLLRTP